MTGAAWGLYTAAGQGVTDPTLATTGHFVVLAGVLLVPTAVGFTADLRVTGSGIAWAVLMGAVSTSFAYVAWYACQRVLSGTAAGSVQLAIPVLTAVGAVLLLGERLSPWLVVAAGLVGCRVLAGPVPLTRRVSPGRGLRQGLPAAENLCEVSCPRGPRADTSA